MKAVIFGATGPIGRQVTDALLRRGLEVRVVSRSEDRLRRDYGARPVERRAADLEDRARAIAAAEGCDLLVHAVGLPAERFELHVPMAENAVAAGRESGARALLVTSYWSYGPGDPRPMPESRPRAGDSRMAAIRAREEEVFLEGGGAVARLPDFFGPEPGLSLLNDALAAVGAGKKASWPGDPDAPRDFLFYGDAGRLLAELALHEEAYGEPWNVPGSGAEPPRRLLSRAAEYAGTRLRLRRIRRWQARLAGLFRSDVRAFVDIMPLYEAPLVLDGSKLRGLLGELGATPYEEALPATLAWLAARESGVTRPSA